MIFSTHSSSADKYPDFPPSLSIIAACNLASVLNLISLRTCSTRRLPISPFSFSLTNNSLTPSTASLTPSPFVALVGKTSRIRPALAASSYTSFNSFMTRSPPGRSVLLTMKQSASSITPAFIDWIPSPASGVRTATTRSATSATPVPN